MSIGKSVKRVDAYDKVTGRARYTDDFYEKKYLVAKILHSTIANGRVIRIDTSEAEKIDGVVKIVTCFDVPQNNGGASVVDGPCTSGCRGQTASYIEGTLLRR